MREIENVNVMNSLSDFYCTDEVLIYFPCIFSSVTVAAGVMVPCIVYISLLTKSWD
jgi:hypothetical protein